MFSVVLTWQRYASVTGLPRVLSTGDEGKGQLCFSRSLCCWVLRNVPACFPANQVPKYYKDLPAHLTSGPTT